MVILPVFALELILAIVFARLFKNKSEKVRLIPILVIGIILLVLEVFKQIIWGYGDGSGYTLYALPFHFCSLFIFIYVLTYFIRGKYQENMRIFTTVCGAMLLLIMLVYPNLIFSSGDVTNYFKEFISFHTVTFHLLASFAFMLMISLNLYTINIRRDLLTLLLGFTIFAIISASMANILKTNYASFYFMQVEPIDTIRQSLVNSIGVFGQILYDVVVWLVDVVVAYLCYFSILGIRKLTLLIIDKIKSK